MASKLPPKRVIQGANVGDVNVVASEKTPKARSDDTNTEFFLKICVQEVQIGVSYNYKQLKNKWDSLKKEFAIWTKLAEHLTWLGWDPVKRENLEYLKCRNEGSKFLDMMEICFKDIVAIGYMALVPYADPSTENEVSKKNAYARMNEIDIEIDNFDDDGDSCQQYNDVIRE
ncbi:uncharacterized protein LOC120273505 [Dioscorea cayenensis subsp. rotundata]|uniref:Uncharacterized protein LOC120273505 n=1 Tax=Dioscorea cayennensis subsp. rotundata TaxID=55577 RepID=A0AB40C8B7_DIOCR|nr:uncharacterized protein LOC120273505 [Dioscorea cayenensis subsp. rotundata]